MPRYDELKRQAIKQEDIVDSYWRTLDSRIEGFTRDFEKFLELESGQKDEMGQPLVSLQKVTREGSREKFLLIVRLGTAESPKLEAQQVFWFWGEPVGFKVKELNERFEVTLHKREFGVDFWWPAFEKIFKYLLVDIGRDSPPSI